MFELKKFAFIIFPALIHNARCTIDPRAIFATEAGHLIGSQTVGTDDHFIDLNHYPSNTCVNHRHNKDNQFSTGYRDSLKIMPYQKSGCFVLYNEPDCRGVRLMFHKVGKEKVLGFDLFELNNNKKEVLVNFNVAPRSLSSCPTSSLLPENEPCWGTYHLRIANTGKEITEACLNVDRNDFAGVNFDAIFLDKVSQQFNVNRHDYNENPQICIETFPQKECSGEVIQYIMADPFTDNDLYLLQKSLQMWHVYDPHIPGSIDTDIMSVRKCPCKPPKATTPKPAPPPPTSPPTSSSRPTTPLPPKPPENEEGLDNENKDSAMEGNKFCQFPGCQSIDSFIKTGKENITDCFVIFNESDCNMNPIFQGQSISRNELLRLTSYYEDFSNWTVADCHDYKEIDQSQSCLDSLIMSEKLEDVLSKMLKTRQSSKYEQERNGESEHSGLIILIIIGGIGFFVLAVLIILSVLYWRNQKRIQAAARRSNQNRIGLKRRVVSSLPAGASGGGGIHHQIDPIGTSVYVNDITGLQALSKFFEKGGLEIPRENINIGNIRDSSAQIIGVGEFSIAFKGILNPEEKIVAVKTMKSGHATTSALKSVLKECRIFVECGKHENIVEFLGVCTERIRSGEIFVVMGYCENGPLKSFLVQHRSHFMSLVKDGELVESEHLKAYAERPIEGGPPTKFNTFQLLRWCLEIADAMEFLTTNKIVHVSLCSKNVMLDTDFKAKLCDFHLARYSAESSYVNRASRLNMNKERNIPWRFYAVESLLDDIFSTKSDVWTFGIFMWEVWTLGATPYPEYSYGGEFTMVLKHGYRLLKPELTTIQCYELMIICWYDDPEKRPTFSKLKARLERMIYSRQEEVHSIAQE